MDEEFDLDEVKKKFDDVQNHLPYLGDLWKANREIFMSLIKEGKRLRSAVFNLGLEGFSQIKELEKENAKLQEANKNLMRDIGR